MCLCPVGSCRSLSIRTGPEKLREGSEGSPKRDPRLRGRVWLGCGVGGAQGGVVRLRPACRKSTPSRSVHSSEMLNSHRFGGNVLATTRMAGQVFGGDMAFLIGLVLFVVVCGFLDSRLPWIERRQRRSR